MILHKYKQVFAVTLVMFTLAGCMSYEPMPASVYGDHPQRHFSTIPDSLQSSEVHVLYATDRVPEKEQGILQYGYDRSFSLAFGEAVIDLGKALSWKELVAWTAAEPSAPENIQPEVSSVREITRFPASPYKTSIGKNGKVIPDPVTTAKLNSVQERIQNVIRRYLALTQRKQIHMHIHGIEDLFDETLIRLAMSYHLYGRQDVPILYSWPAGKPGGLRGYTRDRESGEFTIFHLKEFIKTIAAVDEVQQISITAHSRGTDVIVSAIRELVIEARASGDNPRDTLKIENLVLIAPDLDVDVTSQRVSAETMHFAIGRITIYVNNSDKALKLSSLLFGSDQRIGAVKPSDVHGWQQESLAATNNVDVIFYSGSEGGFMGHSYYRAPAVLADIFLLLDGRLPGASHGRPLRRTGNSMWAIDDNYLQ